MQDQPVNDSSYNSIKTWAEDEKPREKLLHKGAASLSNAELLAILISTGTVKRSALDLGRDVLALAHNNLNELGRLTVAELKKTKGIGEAKAITIAAALELGRRRQVSEGLQRPQLTYSKEVAGILLPLMNDLNYEAFCVLYLNQGNKLIKHEFISNGGLTGTVADVRVILKHALECNASQLILAHNHPSGNLKASKADKDLTEKIKEAADIMNIKLLDHLIIGNGNYMSMSDEGML